jgi:twinkle protein
MGLVDFRQIGIDVKSNRTQQKHKCPNCIKLGKENFNDPCLSINTELGIYNCHKCGWSGKVKPVETIMDIKKSYKKPEKSGLKKLTAKGRKFLNDRGITDEVIDANKIVSSRDDRSIVFPYLKDGAIVNYKQRGVDGKFFMQAKDAESIIYNYDRVKDSDTIVICEGEFDSLSWEVAGVPFHTSVSMGAPNANDKNIDKKLSCISNCYEVFDNAKTIYVATDEDDNGRALQKELVRRFGAEKCLLVDLRPYKDANEVLLNEGVESLQSRLKLANTPKIDGVFEIDDIYDSLMDGFHNGQERGSTTYVDEIDSAWTWRNGEVNIWTGYQNEGKSLFLNQLATLKAARDGWKFAIFSPENMPIRDFYNDIIEMYIGKSSDPYHNHQMSLDEYQEAIEFVKRHFFVIYPKKGFALDTILRTAKSLVRTKGVRSFIIDPYNTIEHKMSSRDREDLYISKFMSELKMFAIENHISIHLVAHQKTPEKDTSGRYKRPDLNSIKGGGTFSDKADNVLMVWRPNRALSFSDTSVVFASQKIKKQKLVGVPQEIDNIEFNVREQRYYFNNRTPFKEIDELRANGHSTHIRNEGEEQESSS